MSHVEFKKKPHPMSLKPIYSTGTQTLLRWGFALGNINMLDIQKAWYSGLNAKSGALDRGVSKLHVDFKKQ